MSIIKTSIKKVLNKSISGRMLLRMNPFLFFVNCLFQMVFRINAACPFLVNYTSRVTVAHKIYIEDDDKFEVLISMACSHGCYIQAINGVYFGKGTMFAPNVTIVSANHDYANYNVYTKNQPVVIGRYCWIGASSVICPGVTLGDHTVVGAGSVVTKSFHDGYVVIGGVPARIIKYLDKPEIIKSTHDSK